MPAKGHPFALAEADRGQRPPVGLFLPGVLLS